MKKILILDSDSDARCDMVRVLAKADYTVMNGGSGILALKRIRAEVPDLVICDTNLKDTNTYELLGEIKKQYPDVIRVLMSNEDGAGQTETFGAILQNVARFFIQKPWDDHKLVEYFAQIFETERILKSKELAQYIQNLEKLPTIESSYQKILKMIEKDANTVRISEEIEKDFAISTKLLQLVNSAYYGLQTGSVRHATVYIGLQNLRSLIYSSSIMNGIDSVPIQYRENITNLWSHALLTNKLLHYIYEDHLNKKVPDESYSAGLLHNIGSLILMHNRIADYAKINATASSKTKDLLELEKKMFHVTHQEAGAYLISWWELPFPIVEAALYHHHPMDANVMNLELVCAVHLAESYAWQLMRQPVTTKFYPEAFDFLNIEKDVLDAAINWKKWD